MEKGENQLPVHPTQQIPFGHRTKTQRQLTTEECSHFEHRLATEGALPDNTSRPRPAFSPATMTVMFWEEKRRERKEGRKEGEEAAVAAFADKTAGLSYRQTTRGPATTTAGRIEMYEE